VSVFAVKKVISGGQTGVDRAALDLALELQIPSGGWCPRGRLSEDGTIPDCYPLKETATDRYPERTRLNVRDSDGTLVLTWGEPTGGTAYTIESALNLEKPVWIVDLKTDSEIQPVIDWLDRNIIFVLNVAGPRESGAPGIYEKAKDFLGRILTHKNLSPS